MNPVHWPAKIPRLIVLAVRYTIDFWSANFTIAKQVLSNDPGIAPEIITIDTEVEKPIEILALANMISFTPGTIALEIEPGKRLEVHVLNDAAGAKQAIPARLERPLLRITR
jgi:multisubunit Na+/H+ antiporter MnhE subunit